VQTEDTDFHQGESGPKFTDIVFKFYLVLCHKIILIQKLRCRQMILSHILG